MAVPPLRYAEPLVRTLAVLAMACLVGCSNFGVVEAGRVYRSAQPSASWLERCIENRGIRTIVCLRSGTADDAHWRATNEPARAAGVDVVTLPLSAYAYPSRERLLTLWETFETAEYPILIHCNGGADRTGLASAVYVLQRTGDLDRALAQLTIHHRHLGFWGTDRLDLVLRRYRDWQHIVSFPDWVRTFYAPPRELPLPDRGPIEVDDV